MFVNEPKWTYYKLTKCLAVSDKNDNYKKKEARKILNGLTDRETKVLKMCFGIDVGSDNALEEVTKQFDITRERIRDIEKKALRKLLDNDDDPDDAA